MKEIPLTQGKVALIDDDDFELVNQFKWYVDKQNHNFYARHDHYLSYHKGKSKKERIKMHRLVLNVPKGFVVDHIDGNGLNNQKSNLRIVSHRQNLQNQKHRKNKTSKYPGVTWSTLGKKWVSIININKHAHYLGLFVNEREAAKAYERACRELCNEELICKSSSK